MPYSIKDDSVFSHSKRVLESKRKSLKSQGKGNKKLKAEPLEKEDIMLMYERNVLGAGKKTFVTLCTCSDFCHKKYRY